MKGRLVIIVMIRLVRDLVDLVQPLEYRERRHREASILTSSVTHLSLRGGKG